ncbi:MAG TPA: hypothetical protein VIF62_26350 [Labilithrix sp.]|jgi:hypothetical protein
MRLVLRGLAAASLSVLIFACSSTSDNVDISGGDAGGDDGATPNPPPPNPPPSPVDGGQDAGPMCGRLTTPCPSGQHCDGAPDCASKVCRMNVCQDASVADGVKNGDETDVDCGGMHAPACVDNKMCLVADDCTSGVCTSGVCQAPNDHDGVKNGDETGVDCGGSATNKCAAGQGCNTTADCAQVKCDTVAHVCLTASHSDGIKNDGETGVDCGGVTGAARCDVGGGCLADTDCNNVKCDVGATNQCLPPSHTDGFKNGDETGVDCGGPTAPNRCPTGQGCVATSDCDNVKCDAGVTNLCLPASHTDGIKNDGETGIDCGGAALPTKCATGQGCGSDADCNNVRCNMISLVCDSATNSDGLKNGTETDIDCGGVGGTMADRCADDRVCAIDGDCASTFCNVNVCVAGKSCKTAATNGITTCGSAGNDTCCRSLAVPGFSDRLDMYNITAGRMRQFVTAVAGDMRGWINANTPAWWNTNWTKFLPTMLDNGQVTPDDTPAFTGVYQELGPYVHGTAGGGNEGCYVSGVGARTYRLPDSVNAKTRPDGSPGMNDPQAYSQAFLDQRALNCVTVYIIAAFCAWDGAHLPTGLMEDAAWGSAKYPWGTQAPAGYDAAYGTDPMGTFGSEEYGPDIQNPPPGPTVPAPFPLTDTLWANYDYNYWGGATQLSTDYSIYIAPPGRFPNGYSSTGHADLAGAVFNSFQIDAAGANAHWSRSGSWQGHNIPWSAKGTFNTFAASNKYWAMGGRCAR